MRLPLPEQLPGVEQLGRVHLSASAAPACPGIARIMLARGVAVSGSDGDDSPGLAALRELGARVHLGHDAAHLAPPAHAVDTGRGLHRRPRGQPGVRRGASPGPPGAAPLGGLAAVMADRRVLAVAGTHGKTTTTSLLTVALQAAGADPTYAVGGVLRADRPQRRGGQRRPLRGRGRRERRRLPGLPPARRDRHQRRGRPPRHLGHRGGLPGRLRRLRRDPRRGRVPGLRRRRPRRGRAGRRRPGPRPAGRPGRDAPTRPRCRPATSRSRAPPRPSPWSTPAPSWDGCVLPDPGPALRRSTRWPR